MGRRPERRGEWASPINTVLVSSSTGDLSMGADEIAHYFFGNSGTGMSKNRKA